MVEVVDAHGAGRGEPFLDPVPRRMLEVERERAATGRASRAAARAARRRGRSSARREPGRAGRRARARATRTRRARAAGCPGASARTRSRPAPARPSAGTAPRPGAGSPSCSARPSGTAARRSRGTRTGRGPPGRTRAARSDTTSRRFRPRRGLLGGRSLGHDGNSDSSGREVHRGGAGAARAALHEPRPAGLRARQPAGDGQGRAVRPLLALRRDAAPAVPRRVRRLAAGGAGDRGLREGERAAKLYERIFLGYGDDSVAQLGGAHIACEWTSNLLTKILQRPRLAAYLEQSTRYIAYDAQLDGFGYRYHRDPRFGPAYETRDGRSVRDVLAAARGRVGVGRRSGSPRRRASRRPRTGAPCARRRSTSCAACCRPRRSRTSASTRAARRTSSSCCICSRIRSPRRARTARCCSRSCSTIIPSFVARVPREDRGGRWIEYLRERARGGGARGGAARARRDRTTRPRRRRCGCSARTAPRRSCSPRCCTRRRRSGRSEALARGRGAAAPSERAALAARARRHAREPPPPARAAASRRSRYRFEIVSDYGAFRDLQRHRLLTCQWQRLSPDLGADVPHEVVAAGLGGEYERALEVSRAEYERLRGEGLAEEAPYALCLAYRIRYVLELDAREALHLIELRSGREGHPSYRAVALRDARRDRRGASERRRGDELRRRLDGGAARAAALARCGTSAALA